MKMIRQLTLITGSATVLSLILNKRFKVVLSGYCEAETIALSSSPTSPLTENKDKKPHENIGLGNAIIKAREYVKRAKEEIGTPGMVIGVSLNGTPVWTEGFGFANVENGVPCHAETVMRIASISKSMTIAVVAKLWEDGKLDIDKPVQHYVPSFPKKTFDGNEVSITTRLLASHLAGIRHYDKEPEDKNKGKDNKGGKNHKNKGKDETQSTSDSRFKEFFYKHKFKDVEESLKIFKDDDLVSKPGTSFLYTTHGWTLISAVVEGVTKEPFPLTMKMFFRVMGLKYTYLDENDPIIYNRACYYVKNPKTKRLLNAPYVDNSYKWAGGGFLSTVGDLLKFGDAMLYSYQYQNQPGLLVGYLQPKTMSALWTPQPSTTMKWGREDGYGMGWVVVPQRQEYGWGDAQQFATGHSGGAVGASSVLVVIPKEGGSLPPSGVSVAILVNLQDVSLHTIAFNVAAMFREVGTRVTIEELQ
uniref:Beta-lactamase-related domain-containing protein n=1 Tax=Timema tahoe TaxID=61484 RepID=A0A7R9IJ38_9NEOP|nr:unnamed protein product [Timema tahoe]